MLPDYHLHSEYSGDSETPVRRLLDAAVDKGLTSICLTDHNDLDFPDTPDGVRFDLDIDSYIAELTKLREEYSGRLDIRIGVEQGVMRETCEKLNLYSKEHGGIDFIICSSHVVDGMDPYYPEFFEGKTRADIWRDYFEDELYVTKHFHDYNVYGHLDYIFRYGWDIGDVSKDNAGVIDADGIDISPYEEIIREILRTIIDTGHGIEINTGSLYRGLGFTHPHPGILRMYHELGGEILTFGSDSHDLTHLGYGFEYAREMAKAAGFRYYTAYKDMKGEMLNL